MNNSIARILFENDLFKVDQEWIPETSYEVITGSVSYGITTESSDTDIVRITVPPLEYIFPTVSGHIPNFGNNPPKFDSSQQHHMNFENNQYDVAIYGLIKFFQLAAENNPNICDVLFVDDKFILHSDNVGKIIRDNRKLFLHKGSY